jgi:hypothetical protein
MKSIFIIFSIALLSVIFSQTTLNLCTLCSLINTENVVDSFIQIEDSSEEDSFTINTNTPFHSTLRECFSSKLSPDSISGISLSVWQPPE